MTVSKATASLTPMRLHKTDEGYIVIGAQLNDEEVEWVQLTKAYAHSTSAFAALGRLYQKELLEK
ncbi:MAG: hypothetical protein EOO17_00800 [Chloroflexi bacterium]|nr:MAG: hypothetical protein EOO17_00800 [Chloroflexota bacterium]